VGQERVEDLDHLGHVIEAVERAWAEHHQSPAQHLEPRRLTSKAERRPRRFVVDPFDPGRHRASGWFINGTHFVRRDPDGMVLLDTRTLEPPFEMPTILSSEPLAPHSLENVGDVELRFIAVEPKN